MWRIAFVTTWAVAWGLITARAADDQKDVVTGGLALYIAESEAQPTLEPVKVEGRHGETIYLHPKPFLTGEHVAAAKVVQDNGRPAIDLTFDDAGREAMAEATGDALPTPEGRYKLLAFVLDGKVIFAPRINSQIAAKARVAADFNQQEAEALAAKLAPPAGD